LGSWGVIGVWWMMAREMQERGLPTAWLGFALWVTIYLTGLLLGKMGPGSGVMVTSGVAFLVTLSMSLMVVWFEPRDFVFWRRLMLNFDQGDTKRFLQDMPCWLSTLPVALIAAIFLALFGKAPMGFGASGGEWAIALVIWLFALRDIAILHFFSLGRKTGKVVITTMVYLMVLYLIVPNVLFSLGMDAIAHVLIPNPLDQPWVALGAALINAGAAVVLTHWRWSERREG